ncbi:porin [Rhodoferax sp.]|uniref:porin n=1 Tax=Rhodoferax sp. TaxID=50421 RepID=UPI0025DC6773|nr:porin [Rhodoferax sp.]
MKKTLIALAVLSATSAFAQVTLTGTVRAAYQKTNSSDFTENQSGLALTDATIGVAATEDLGSGMKASAGITLDQNSSAFPAGSAPAGTAAALNTNGSRASTGSINRRNTFVQVQGDFGLVRFDQTRSGDLITRAWVAPSNLDQGIYDGSNIVARAGIDALTYGMAFGPVTASLQYVETGADGVSTPNVNVTVLNLGYANGPLAAGFSIKSSAGAGTTNFARTINNEAFVTYDFGVARVGLGWDGAMAAASSANADANALAFGVAVPVTSALTLGANYATRDVNNTTEFAAAYSLSKRTVFNASYGRQTAKETATRTADQFRISLAHNF